MSYCLFNVQIWVEESEIYSVTSYVQRLYHILLI